MKGLQVKVEVNSKALFSRLNPRKSTNPISSTYEGVIQNMIFREAWEDKIQVETLNLRGLREPREHDQGERGGNSFLFFFPVLSHRIVLELEVP